MRVLLVDERQQPKGQLRDSLESHGHTVTGSYTLDADLSAAIRIQYPDVVVIDLAMPKQRQLNSIARFYRENPRPIVMITADGSSQSIQEAIQAGVTTYVVDGFNENRLSAIMEVSMARFKQQCALEHELKKTRRDLDERKLIDRAKGILMQKRGMSESEAYGALRSMAMEQNQRMAEVAKHLMAAAKLLG